VTPPSHPNRTIPSTLEKDLVRTQWSLHPMGHLSPCHTFSLAG
jgi:hypothetical protein